MSQWVADVIYRHRRLLTAFILIGAALLAPRANITRIDNDLTAWFSRSDPVYREYERFRDQFGGTRNLIVALKAPSRERLFSRDLFDTLDAISRDIEQVPAVERVSSLATANVVDIRPGATAADDATLDVRPLLDDLDSRGPEAVGRRALDDPLLRGDLISEDGTVTAVVVFFDERRIDDVRAQTLAEIRRIVTAGLPAGFEAHYNGSLEISEEYNRVTLDNQQKFTPPILLLTLVAIFVMFRSWRRVLITLLAVLVSAIWTLGLYDLLGFSYNVLTSIIVPLVIVLAIADDVHIMQHYQEARRRGTPEEAFKGTIRHLLAPLLGASGTTALGMASLATSQVLAVQQFGIGAALGVMVDFVISIVLMPTMLGWVRPDLEPPPQETYLTGPMLAVARVSTRRAPLVLVIATLVTVVAAYGLQRLKVDTNHINFFSPDHPLGRSASVIDTHLGGIYTFQILLEGGPDSLKQPDALRRLAGLTEALRQLPLVRKATGLADYVERVHREIGEPGGPPIPSDANVIAQELFVFTLSDRGRAELERIVLSDFSKTHITVKLASLSSDVVFEQVEVAERIANAAFAGSGITTTVTGSGRLFSTLDHYLVVSQITSFGTAFLTVFAVIFLVFRSWRFGLLAIIPNLFPVLAIFGAMGWIGISLNVATVMLASVALGVVDDDTIHFISRYRRETAAGRSTDEAIELATVHEGRASLTTAVINSCAFGVLALSPYRPTAWFGAMLAFTMLLAFLAEVFILPATIKLMPRLFGADRVHARRKGRP